MPRLSDDAIRDILTSIEISAPEMGRRYGRSHQAIVQIRLGQTNADRLPELPRWAPGRSCETCAHFRDQEDPCSLGLPDPREEGVRFGQHCSAFAEVR
jgi:hypothetical protein